MLLRIYLTISIFELITQHYTQGDNPTPQSSLTFYANFKFLAPQLNSHCANRHCLRNLDFTRCGLCFPSTMIGPVYISAFLWTT